MKKLLMFLLVTLFFIGYLNKTVNATTCANAVVVPSTPTMPYVITLACGTANDITSANSTSCGSGSYKGGNEAVYTWTPASNYINVSFAYTGVTYVGIFLYQGCPTSGGTCVGNYTSSGSAKTLAYVGTNLTSGTKISVTAGVTYYIVIDTWPSPTSPCPGTLTINGIVSNPCVTPTNQPTSLVYSNVSSTSLTGTYTAAAGSDSYLVVRSTSNTHDTPPVDGTAYTAGATLGNGTIAYSGSALTFNATGLSSSTQYYYFVYSMNSLCSGGPKYYTSSPLNGTVTTGPAAPASFTASAQSSSMINFSATSNASNDNVLIAWNTSNTFGTPTGSYAEGDVISGGGTVLFYGNAADAPKHNGLTPATTYYYKIWSELNTLYSSALTANATTLCNVEVAPTMLQDFTTYTGAAPQPNCWSEATGTLAATTTLTGTTSEWTSSSGFANAGTNKGVKVNLYSTGNDWIISQQIDLGSTPGLYRLKYDIAVTGYNATTSQTTLGTHKVDVVISTDGGLTWSNANIIKSYTGAGTYSNTGQTETINLTSYSGIVKFAFVETTTSSTPDIDFHIDNFVVETLPSCYEPTALNATNVTLTSASINWTASVSNPTSGYQYEVRTSGAAGSGATGLVSSGTTAAGIVTANISSLTANTTYSFYVRSDCGGGNIGNWTSASSFFTGYCNPAPTSVDGTGITNVSFSSINNTTGTETNNYGNYSAMIADIQRSTTVDVSITYATGYTYDTKIWIDWNDDLDFNDAGEEVYSGTSLSTNPTTLVASFTVPVDAILGNHRMRIGGQDSGPTVPCYSGSYGSFEDYTVNVLEAPSCLAPTSLLATPAVFSADLSWTEAGTATSWDIEWGLSGFIPTGTPTITGVTNPYTLNGLAQSTAYAYYVRANCGGTNSTWTGPKTFTTTVACPEPTALTTNNTTTTTANLSWTSTAGAFEIEYGVAPYAFTGTANVTNILASNKELTGLQTATTYQYKVKAICGGLYGESLWSATGTFTTACDNFTLPFTENFSSASFPNCWSTIKSAGVNDLWSVSATNNTASGANEIKCTYQQIDPGTSKLITPPLSTTGLSAIKLSFKHYYDAYAAGVTLKVRSSSDKLNWTDESWTLSPGVTNIGPSFVDVLITNNLGSVTYLAFEISGNLYNTDGWFIDNVSVTLPQAGLWTGTTNNDWSTATNWDNGIAPNANANVTIPATAPNFPTLTSAVTVNNLTIESNATGTGSLLDNGYLTITGTATVKQYVQGEKWHMISSPVQNALSGVFHLAAGQADIYIRQFNAGAWSYITNLTTPLVAGKAYSIWADTQTNSTPHPTIPFVGALNIGDITLQTTGTVIDTVWNLLGNPFVSAIDWNTVNPANVDGSAVRVWNQTLTVYSTYSQLGGSLNGGNRYLAPMQGFFVKSFNSNGITIGNANRVHNGQLFVKSSNTINDLVKITAKRGIYKDEINVVMNPIATNNYDAQYDATKLFVNDANIPEIYTVLNNKNLAINIFGSAPIAIPMNIRMGVADNVTLTASEFANFDANVNITLEDMLTGTTQDLRQNPSYTFAASIGENANRFVLHFATASGINEPNAGNISIYANENTIYVNTTEKVKEISVYNMLGQVITSVSGSAKSLQTISMDNASGNYVVKVTTEKGVKTEKVFVK